MNKYNAITLIGGNMDLNEVKKVAEKEYEEELFREEVEKYKSKTEEVARIISIAS